jgi:hypothetical protein
MILAAGAAVLLFLAAGIAALRDLDALDRRFALMDRERRIRRVRLKVLVAVALAGGAALGVVLVAVSGAAYGEHKVDRLTHELSAAQRGLFRLEQELSVTHAAPPAPAAVGSAESPAGRARVRSSGEVMVRVAPDGAVMGSLNAGAMVEVVRAIAPTLRGQNEWRQVRLADGRVGWIADRFLEHSAADPPVE